MAASCGFYESYPLKHSGWLRNPAPVGNFSLNTESHGILAGCVPSGYVKIAIENDPVEIVDFPMKNGGSFQFAFCKRLPGRVLVHDFDSS